MATEGTTRMHILIPPTINESVSFRIVILFLPFQKSIRRNGSHREVDQSGNSLRVGTRTGSGYHCHSDWFAARVVLGDIPFTKVDDGKAVNNTAWTLGADRNAEHVCRRMQHLDETKTHDTMALPQAWQQPTSKEDNNHTAATAQQIPLDQGLFLLAI